MQREMQESGMVQRYEMETQQTIENEKQPPLSIHNSLFFFVCVDARPPLSLALFQQIFFQFITEHVCWLSASAFASASASLALSFSQSLLTLETRLSQDGFCNSHFQGDIRLWIEQSGFLTLCLCESDSNRTATDTDTNFQCISLSLTLCVKNAIFPCICLLHVNVYVFSHFFAIIFSSLSLSIFCLFFVVVACRIYRFCFSLMFLLPLDSVPFGV